MNTSSTSSLPTVDVFVSFRGEDVRKTILSHLSREFARKGIKSFKKGRDDDDDETRPPLLREISQSRVTVVLLSESYASSSWCLNELVEILEKKPMTVVPVYYEVDMSEVRQQRGRFKKYFERHALFQNSDKLQSWKLALFKLTNIVPFFSSRALKDDSKLIHEITLCVSGLLSKSRLIPGKAFRDKSSSHLVSDSDQIMASINTDAIYRQIKSIYTVLDLESTNEVRVIGIYGVGGIGKTTIARHLYNELSSSFQNHCFLDHISGTRGIHETSIMSCLEKKLTSTFQDHCLLERSSKFHDQGLVASSSSSRKEIQSPRGLKRKAAETLCSVLGSGDKKRTRFCQQRVLVIVDNVETTKQLEKIMKDVDSLGSGSRVIVTTRNKSLLLHCGVKHVYEVDCLKYDEALELFSGCAFKKQYPPANFQELSFRAVQQTGNLPLGLKVLGSYLRGRNKEEWEYELKKLEARATLELSELSSQDHN